VDGQSPSCAYVAWADDRNGQADIYVASSTTHFASTTETRVTSHAASQTEPDVAIDSSGTVYIVWTDGRNGHTDIYGAASDTGPWTNRVIVGSTSSQSNPALAAERDGLALHLVWVDDAAGDTDVYYASFAGLTSDSLTGSTIIDDTSGADQIAPAIACLDSARVFACWEDYRHVGSYGSDSDLFLTDLGTGAAKTNVLVGDAGTGANQREPALGVDQYDNPYVVWADDREGATGVYYAATTFIDPNPLDAKEVVASVGATVGVEPALIDKPQDVSIMVPAGACQADVRMTIAEILNPRDLPVQCLGSYDFGPSGIEFNRPVTVTIPYRYAHAESPALPFWYDSLTGALSQHGITDIENLVISDDLSALRFNTTHFTPFYLVIDDVQSVDDSPVSGGCSVSAGGHGSPTDLLVPYALVALVMIVLRRRDLRRRGSAVSAEG
jgi:MYXO-CTERM domain-containing protein